MSTLLVIDDIPQSLHNRVKRILGITNSEDYESYIATIISEAEVFLKMKLSDGIVLADDEKRLAINLYVQYTMFSKTENENVARDKIITLSELISSVNEKYSEKKNELKVPKKGILIL